MAKYQAPPDITDDPFYLDGADTAFRNKPYDPPDALTEHERQLWTLGFIHAAEGVAANPHARTLTQDDLAAYDAGLDAYDQGKTLAPPRLYTPAQIRWWHKGILDRFTLDSILHG